LSAHKPGWTTIVGVIADARTESLADAGVPQVYLDIYQQSHIKDLAFFLRGQVDPAAIAAQVRAQIQAVDPELPVFRAETADDVLSSSLSVRRFSMEMVALFAATALLLAGLGIYGTISYVVDEQRREIALASRWELKEAISSRWRHPCTYHCRARGQLYPGAARHAPRSNHYTPLRITSWQAD
jgi:hypothetical protein